MVEQEAVNFEVASSSLAGGAKFEEKIRPQGLYFLLQVQAPIEPDENVVRLCQEPTKSPGYIVGASIIY